jgi:hypothetical protein
MVEHVSSAIDAAMRQMIEGMDPERVKSLLETNQGFRDVHAWAYPENTTKEPQA